ncbi:nucleotidyltransferase family protein [Halobacteria archaeon AArc-m2/3/4]|uniref:Nucleotidyltransferase family protein n=1 Tax=Natronoglomus mannanivorans TaxID=2979990 RepID=A0AAP2Z1N3_9EURY|nr:nucleotidyltransferase family protein [Halobacteria archaeon AArc-xg1-1]MCU4974885.1 nucleotidyltransferase family protein [Halobacteria archaeon AArc-m2/3/4]
MGEIDGGAERLVVECIRASGTSGEELTASLEGPREIDWDNVLDITSAHGVTTLVSKTLHRHRSDAVPDGILEELQARSQFFARRNLRMMQEVAALSAAFDRHDIRAIPYRGPVVADVAYGSVGHREFGDLDFLVLRDDLPAAKSVLLERGYEPRYTLETTAGLTNTQEWAYVQFARDYPFDHESDPFEVELHWRIVSQHFPTGIDLETVWERRSSLSIAGTEVPVLSHEDRLLMCCVHGTRHRWERLQWLCDVARYVESHSFDWDVILERAKDHHCERMLLLGLAVTRDVLDTPLPDVVQQPIDADPTIEPLVTHVRDRLFDDTDYWRFDLKRYQSRTLERYRDKGKFWLYWALKPDRGDIERVSLPKPLVPLYVGVRCLRLMAGAANRLSTGGRTAYRRREVKSK